jgi:hypothetical protein
MSRTAHATCGDRDAVSTGSTDFRHDVLTAQAGVLASLAMSGVAFIGAITKLAPARRSHTYAIAVTLILAVSACSSPGVEEDPTNAPTTPSPTADATSPPTQSFEAETTPAPTLQATATPGETDPFAETDTCSNADEGWTVEFPESWWTNTAFTHSSGEEVPACWMFSVDEFDATDGRNPNQPASGAELYLRLVPPPGMVGVSGEIASEDDVTVDGFEARRVDWRGTESDTTEMGEDDRLLQYVVELPDGVEFMAFADSTRTSDYDHAVEVLDGMMERIDLGDR